ncbi:MAG: hypothetical protein ACRC8F_04195 [Cetobacterium sp.]
MDKVYMKVKLFIGDTFIEYNSDNFNIEYKLERDRETGSDLLQLAVYNLKDSSKRVTEDEFLFLAQKPSAELYVGYVPVGTVINDPYLTLIYKGQYVQNIPTVENLDYKFNFAFMQEREALISQTISVTYSKGFKASQIITDLINKFGSSKDSKLKIGDISKMNDITYSNQFSMSAGTLKKALTDICKDTYNNFYVKEGFLYVYPITQTENVDNIVEFKNIIKFSPDDEGIEITTFFYDIKVNTKLTVIDSMGADVFNKNYCVRSVIHEGKSEGDGMTTTIKLLDLALIGEKTYLELEKKKKKAEKKGV